MASSSNAAAKQDNFMEKNELINFHDPNIYHDRVLVVGDKNFYVQSGILSMSSDYFRGLFNSNFTEANQKEIIIEDVDPLCFEHFLKMIYPPHLVRETSADQMEFTYIQELVLLGVMSLSFRFLCPSVYRAVRKSVDRLVRAGLSGFNFGEFASVAILHDIEEYKELVLKSLSDPTFASKKKEKLKEASDHVTKFLLDAYLDGKILSYEEFGSSAGELSMYGRLNYRGRGQLRGRGGYSRGS